MKVKHLSALAGAGVAVIIAAPASAVFTGLSLVHINDWTTAGTTTQADFDAAGYQTWQIFAKFDEASDNLLVMGSVFNPFTLSASDGFIYNNEAGGFGPTRNGWDGPLASSGFAPAPGSSTIPYDSHTGIGLNLAPIRYGDADGDAGSNPSFHAFGAGLNSSDVGIVVSPSSGDGLAGVGLSVFLMQITWNASAFMTVNFDFTYSTTLVPAQGLIQITESHSVFIGLIPAPGALALLGLAGLVGRPRRRRA